jgi:flagellar biosynthesis/type III secretory pathway chaperone
MEPLEQVTVLMTLMKRLGQVMDHERTILHSMRLDALPDVQDEKAALAEAYEIELGRLRTSPETLATLDASIREQLYDAMRQFQDNVSTNLNALLAAQSVVEKVLRNIADGLTRHASSLTYGAGGQAAQIEPRGQVISVAFDRKL